MDVECRVAAEGGHCYLDHLPLLGMTAFFSISYIYCFCTILNTNHYSGSEYEPSTSPFLCAGDRARLEMDLELLKSRQDRIHAWDEDIALV